MFPRNLYIFNNSTLNLFLHCSPYFRRIKTIAPNPRDINARRELPQPYPSLSYIGMPASGSIDAVTLRNMLPAAIALAANSMYASIIYTVKGIFEGKSKSLDLRVMIVLIDNNAYQGEHYSKSDKSRCNNRNCTVDARLSCPTIHEQSHWNRNCSIYQGL